MDVPRIHGAPGLSENVVHAIEPHSYPGADGQEAVNKVQFVPILRRPEGQHEGLGLAVGVIDDGLAAVVDVRLVLPVGDAVRPVVRVEPVPGLVGVKDPVGVLLIGPRISGRRGGQHRAEKGAHHHRPPLPFHLPSPSDRCLYPAAPPRAGRVNSRSRDASMQANERGQARPFPASPGGPARARETLAFNA